MAEQQRIAQADGRRATVAPPARGRLVAANDNMAPARHIVGKLLVSALCFAGTFGIAWWWLG